MVSDTVLRRVIPSTRFVAVFGDLLRLAIAVGVIVLILLSLWYHAAVMHFMAVKLHMNDFGKFYYSARLFLDGADMYGPSPATAIPINDVDVGQFLNMNPPHFHLIMLPLALLTPERALQTWVVLNLAAFLLSLSLITRELGLRWTASRVLWATLAVLVFSSTGAVILTGQLTFLLMIMLTIAWRAARQERLIAAACWLGALASIKPFLGIFALYFVLRRQLLPLCVMGATAVASFAIGLLVFGWPAYQSWFGALRSANWSWPPMNGSITGFFARSFAESPIYIPVVRRPDVARAGALAGSAVVAALSVRALWQISRRPAARAASSVDRAFALLVLTSLLVTPLGWVYYLWLIAGPFLALRYELAPGLRSWRTWILVAAIPGALWPLFLVGRWEAAWVTVTFNSAYFWLTIALWLAVVLPVQREAIPAFVGKRP
jgi:hypothetical protein